MLTSGLKGDQQFVSACSVWCRLRGWNCVRIWLSDALIANSSADCVVSFFIEKNYSVKINY